MNGKFNVYYEFIIYPKSISKLENVPNLKELLQSSIEVLNKELTVRKRIKKKDIKEDGYVNSALTTLILF